MHALWLILSEDGQHRPRQDDFTGGTDPAAVKKALGHGLGQISRALGSHGVDPRTGVRALNRLQKFLREETRLGIPALSHEECLVGLMARGATLFPSALAYGATWNPDLVERAAQAIGREARSVGLPPGAGAGARRLARRALGPHRGDAGRGPVPGGRAGHPLRPRPAGREARPAGDAQALRRPLLERGRAQPRAGAPRLARAQRRVPAPVRDGREAGARGIGDAGVPRHRQRVLPRVAPPAHRGAARGVGLRRADRGRLHRHQPALPAPQPRPRIRAEAAALAFGAGLDIELPADDCASHLGEALQRGLISIETIDEIVRRILTREAPPGAAANGPTSTKGRSSCRRPAPSRWRARWRARRWSCSRTTACCRSIPRAASAWRVIGPTADDPLALLCGYSFPVHLILNDAGEAAAQVVTPAGRVREGLRRREGRLRQGLPHHRGAQVRLAGVPGRRREEHDARADLAGLATDWTSSPRRWSAPGRRTSRWCASGTWRACSRPARSARAPTPIRSTCRACSSSCSRPWSRPASRWWWC